MSSSADPHAITCCRLCGLEGLVERLRLVPTPPANAFSTRQDSGARRYDLNLMQCARCGHMQLGCEVDRGLLFSDYLYVSGISGAFSKHFADYAEVLVDRLAMEPGDRVIDIGSNDGTLLAEFLARGMRVWGIEPAGAIASNAIERGIPTMPVFFTRDFAQWFGERHHAKLVTANNVFAHVHDLHDFIEGVRLLLAPGGTFVFEVAYGLDLVDRGLIDTIYHEHLDYHSVAPLRGFFEEHGLELVDVERIPTHGGSLRGYVGSRPPSTAGRQRIARLVQAEEQLCWAETWQGLAGRLSELQGNWARFITSEGKGRRLAAYGASAKATTLLHQLVGAGERIEYVVDDSPLKQGRYVPGTNIPILGAGQARALPRRPDFMLITAWNLADEILAKLEDFRAGGGRVIIPLPEWRIV